MFGVGVHCRISFFFFHCRAVNEVGAGLLYDLYGYCSGPACLTPRWRALSVVGVPQCSPYQTWKQSTWRGERGARTRVCWAMCFMRILHLYIRPQSLMAHHSSLVIFLKGRFATGVMLDSLSLDNRSDSEADACTKVGLKWHWIFCMFIWMDISSIFIDMNQWCMLIMHVYMLIIHVCSLYMHICSWNGWI